MVTSDTSLQEYEGFVFKELHERFPERADALQGLIEERRAQGRCDLCGAPLSKGDVPFPIVAAHVVGISQCEACRKARPQVTRDE